MEIHVTGRHIDIGASFRSHVEERLNTLADKFFNGSIDGSVTVSKDGPFYSVDCLLHPLQGINLQSRCQGEDVYGAFDVAAEKLEKQLRRHKRRIKNHHHSTPRNGLPVVEAQAYVLAEADDAGAEETESQPIIIAETRTQIPSVSVGDAVMLMDLSEAPAMMFRNAKTDRLNMVYRRTDGHIGWIDPPAEGKN